MKLQKNKIIAISIFLFCLSSFAVFTGIFRLPFAGSDPNYPTDRFFYCVINIIFWTTGAYLLSLIIQKVIWSGIFKFSLGSKTIGRIEDFATVFVYLAALTAIFAVVFKQEITAGFLGIFIAAWLFIGFIRQRLLVNYSRSFFAAQRPFKTEDKIRLINKNGSFSVCGTVLRFDGKAIHLKTEEDTLMIFSLAMLDDFIIENYSGIRKEIKQQLSFELNACIPPERAKRILTGAVNQALQKLGAPEPCTLQVSVNNVSGCKIEYLINYKIIPWENYSLQEIKDELLVNIIDHLRIAGANTAGELNNQDILRQVLLFNSLDGEERKKLADSTYPVLYKRGSKIIKQGEKGNSMYVVAEGLLNVNIKAGEQEKGEIKVGLISPGQFFGEMSLFTGEDRSATVIAETDSIVYEINKDAIKGILEKNPKLTEEFGRIIAERQIANIQKLDDYLNRKDSIMEKIIGKIKSYFEL